MAAVVTKVAGPNVKSGIGSEIIFSVALDSSYATGGEPIDLTDWFGYIHAATVGGSSVYADQGYKFSVQIPAAGTEITSSNVLITAHHSSGADAVMNPADAEDLSTVVELALTVVGKEVVSTTWT